MNPNGWLQLTGCATWSEVEELHGRYARDAEMQVASWKAAHVDADFEEPYALYAARQGIAPKSRFLTKPPTDWGRAVEYGVDANGVVSVGRRFSVVAGRRRIHTEHLWTTSAAGGLQLLFGHGSDGTINLSRIAQPIGTRVAPEGVFTWFDPRGELGHAVEYYSYDDGRVTQIRAERHRPGHVTISERFDARYGVGGHLVRIDGHLTPVPPGADPEPLVYLRSPSSAVRTARKAVLDAMPGAIMTWAARNAVTQNGDAQRLLIAYDRPPNDVLPPALALGTSEDRASVAEPDDLLTRFAPAEQAVLDARPHELLDHDGLREAFATVNQEWRTLDDTESPRRLFVEVAKRLSYKDWTETIPRLGDDFKVVAVDFELADLQRNLPRRQ
jgi:hypothetical protein